MFLNGHEHPTLYENYASYTHDKKCAKWSTFNPFSFIEHQTYIIITGFSFQNVVFLFILVLKNMPTTLFEVHLVNVLV